MVGLGRKDAFGQGVFWKRGLFSKVHSLEFLEIQEIPQTVENRGESSRDSRESNDFRDSRDSEGHFTLLFVATNDAAIRVPQEDYGDGRYRSETFQFAMRNC